MPLSKGAQINLVHHAVLSCSYDLKKLGTALYGKSNSAEALVPLCQHLLKSTLKAFVAHLHLGWRDAFFMPTVQLLDAFVLPGADDVKICGEIGLSAHWAVLAVSGKTLISVTALACLPPHEASSILSDGRAGERLGHRIWEILEPRLRAYLADFPKDWRKERDPRVAEAMAGIVRIGQEHGLRKTMDTLREVVVAEAPEVFSLLGQGLYLGFLSCLDEVFPQMEDAHIPVLREQLCFIKSHELSEAGLRLKREWAFARENLPAEVAEDDAEESSKPAAPGDDDTLSGGEWFDTPPPEDSKFKFGPVEGQISKLAQWMNMDQRTLKTLNGRTSWWIQKLLRTNFAIWFSTDKKHAELNQKQMAEEARNDTK
jgi:hypothetical protein